jgi:hypothetical protein
LRHPTILGAANFEKDAPLKICSEPNRAYATDRIGDKAIKPNSPDALAVGVAAVEWRVGVEDVFDIYVNGGITE